MLRGNFSLGQLALNFFNQSMWPQSFFCFVFWLICESILLLILSFFFFASVACGYELRIEVSYKYALQSPEFAKISYQLSF